MRPQLWDFRYTRIDLEDLDVSVELTHPKSLARVTIRFRVDESALEGSARDLKARIELIGRQILLNAATSLEGRSDPTPSS